MKPNNFIPVKCDEHSFYRAWIEFLVPYHKLTSREQDVAARILETYFKLREHIEDPEVLRDVLWSRSSRKDMMEAEKMTQAHFQMVLGKLKKAGFLVDWNIAPMFIPHKGEGSRFVLAVVFDWSSRTNPITRPISDTQ